jgi:DNA-binding transcriptional MocR family regulator
MTICDSTNVIDDLVERLQQPSSRGLADAVSWAIRDGVLAPGDRLPPIRTLAKQLQLSPTTVSAAWALLVRAGAIETGGRRGTVVAIDSAGPRRYRRALDRLATFSLDLSTGVPDPALLPDLRPALRAVQAHVSPGSYLDEPVLPQLADVLRADWPYECERITVVDGAMDAQDLIATHVLRFGDPVAVENPGFPPLLDLLESLGARLVPVAVDPEGARPDALAAALETGVRAVFLQPRAHNPTGASFTQGRVRELARILANGPGDRSALVVEDDSAGAISSSPALSIGRHLPKRTLHIRSFSKSHGPDLRLAALGGPAELVDPLVERRLLGQGWTSRLLQSVLLDLLTRPSSVEQVERARGVYAQRRRALVAALSRHGVDVTCPDGINLWLPVRDETAALVRLASQGIAAAAGAPFLVRADEPHLRVTAGLIADDVEHVAEALVAAAGTGGWAGPR